MRAGSSRRGSARLVAAALTAFGLVAHGLVAGPVPVSEAAFPGEDGLIAYSRTEPSVGVTALSAAGAPPATNLRTVRPDGSGDQPLTDLTDALDPAWSADGTRVAFARTGFDTRGIWVVDADGSDLRRLTTAAGTVRHLDPAWSPQGERIVFEFVVFSSLAGPSTSLVTVDVSSGALASVAGGGPGTVFRDPVWSPVSGRIAYITRFDSSTGGDEVWQIFPNGAQPTQVTATESGKAKPDFSPDGAQIVYQDGLRLSDLAIVSAAGVQVANPQELGDSDFSEALPTWSPSGDRIAFVRFPGVQTFEDEIFTMDPDGSDLSAALTATAGARITGTDWQPLEPPPPPDEPEEPPLTDEPPPPPTEPTPVLLLDRPVSPTGEVPIALGSNFPPNTDVLLRWSPGLGSVATRSSPTGTLAAQVLVLPKDTLGNRAVVAEIGGNPVAAAPILIVPGTFQPGGFGTALLIRR